MYFCLVNYITKNLKMKPILLLSAVSGLSSFTYMAFLFYSSFRNSFAGVRCCGAGGAERTVEGLSPSDGPGVSCGGEGKASGVESRMEETLADIYARIENYFQTAKPYLEGYVSITGLAQLLYTNKMYVSLAVKRFSGLNFCQYVNRHRVRYAMVLFRRNQGLRMSELAQLSGFNSVTSFNISFRYFMDETPGDWCRRCRNGICDEMPL